MRFRGTVGAALAAMTGVVAVGWALVEARHWRANRRLPRGRGGRRVLLVLGCPPRPDGSVSPVQRWRVDLAVRSWRPGDVVVFSGGAIEGLACEADVMAGEALRRGLPETAVVRETRARSTWQNIEYSLPWLRPAAEIVLVSDPLHAARAVRQLAERDVGLAGRVVRLPGYRIGEHPVRKTTSALFESPLQPFIVAAYRWCGRVTARFWRVRRSGGRV
jgi:uncharacterized SAM-binding protein YcdF (DUF218 family)